MHVRIQVEKKLLSEREDSDLISYLIYDATSDKSSLAESLFFFIRSSAVKIIKI